MGNAEIAELTKYIRVLVHSATTTTQADDRTRYQRHLAEAAEILPVLIDGDQAAVGAWVDHVSHSFGWDFLSGPEGDRAEAAFVDLRSALGYPQ